MAVAELIEVADAPDRDRYELSIEGEVVGFTTYRARPGLIAFVHTEVDERLERRVFDTTKRPWIAQPYCDRSGPCRAWEHEPGR